MDKKYSDAERYSLVEKYYNGEAVADICREAGVARSTFYTWVKRYKKTSSASGKNEVSPAEFVKIKRHLDKLEQTTEIMKRVTCNSSDPLQDKLKAMEKLYGQFSVRTLCEALEVPRGTFYNHILRNKRGNTSYQLRRDQLSEQIHQVFDDSNQIFGAKKIAAILKDQGVIVSDKMVSELMREMNLQSIRKDAKRNYKRFSYEKKQDHLKMNFSASAPNQIWVSDVTYFSMKGETCYICVVLDLYSRKVIACKISKKHSTQLISATFKMAYADRKPDIGLVFHSDRGTQYTSYAFQKLLKSCGVKQSFSPSGKPRHNAVMESFFSSMKQEELYRVDYRSMAELKERVERYIQFYNNERPHSTLGNIIPNAYEQRFYTRGLD